MNPPLPQHFIVTSVSPAISSGWRALWLLLLTVWSAGLLRAAAPELTVTRLEDGRLELRWAVSTESYALESGSALTELPNWQAATESPTVENGFQVVRTAPSAGTRFYRLRQLSGPLVTVTQTSPVLGEATVSVTREVVFELSGALATGTSLSLSRVSAEAAGRPLLSRADLSADRRRATLFFLENLPPGTRITVTFDGTDLRDDLGRAVDLDGDGTAGGSFVLTYETANTARLAGTSISGRVLASEKGAGGADVPLVGVTISVDGQEETLRTTSAADGSFVLTNCPAGRFFVNVDGRTATASQWPAGAYYPVIGKAWVAEAGRTNNLAGGTGLIYLPLVAAGTLQPVSEVAETKVTFPESVVAANPALAGVEIRVPANGLFSDNGTRGGLVGLAPVASDRLPEPLPAGLSHVMDISIQTSGPQNFTAPVPARFPNLVDPATGVKLAPGAKSALWSFNHDTGRWELQGSMTVSPDGNFLDTDAGVGIRQPGWHGSSPGTQGGGGPPPPCSPGGILAEGTSSCGPPDNCPEEPSESLREARQCEARAAACALKCYEDCGTAGKPESLTDLASLAKDCREGAICSKQCLDDGKDCKEKALKCLLGLGGFRRVTRWAEVPDPLELEAQRIIALLESLNARWIALADLMSLAPSLEQLPPAQRAQAELLAGEIFDTMSGQAPAAFAQAQTRRLLQAALLSPLVDEFLPPVSGYYVLEDLESGLVRRGRTEPRGILSGIIMRAETQYRIRLLLGPGLSYFEQTFVSGANGQQTEIPYGRALTLSNTDVDGDGIPAEAEFVLGTRDDRADTDGDGVKDLTEIRNQSNPLDGQPAVTGVVASLDTPGNATDLVSVGSRVYLADGSAGVAVVDVSNPLSPVLVRQADTPGVARAIAAEGDIVAVADGPQGLAVLNIANSANPVLRENTPLGGVARAVALANGVAYVGLAGGDIVAVDVQTGLVRNRVRLPGNPLVEDVLVSEGIVYVWAAGKLSVLDVRTGGLELLRTVDARVSGGQFDRQMRLTMGSGRLFGAFPTGVAFFDLTDPLVPTVLAAPSTTQNGWKQLVQVLPNLALTPDGVALVDEPQHDVSVYSLGDNGTSLNFLSRFPTPGVSFALVLDRGLAFLADGPSGLQVINFAPTDQAGIPPTVTLEASFPLDPAQVESGQRARVVAVANDDVMVRQVEFFLNGERVATDGGWPFELVFNVPERTAAVTQFRLQVRATDVGGNVTDSPELTVAILPDQTPPRVISLSPRDGAVVSELTQLVAFFTEPLDATSLAGASFILLSAGPDLDFGTADDAGVVGSADYDSATLSAVWTPGSGLGNGRYRLTVQGVKDLAGNSQTQAAVAQFYIAPGGADGDADNDGLSNAEEGEVRTSPFVADTDGDGWGDEVEVSDQKDPRDPTSRPSQTFVSAPLTQIEVADAADQLAAGNGPVVARPLVDVEVTDLTDELPTSGTWVAKPPVRLEVSSNEDQIPLVLGPQVARPRVTLEVSDPADQISSTGTPVLAKPPVRVTRP
ncbi:MAG: Ig-like domain-containing protein [Verrucomicrobia bacterium]|nr:Ig-like domain-containing protein [Verrucomicrobiota bacterium]